MGKKNKKVLPKKEKLDHKVVLQFLIERLKKENQIFDESTEKSVISFYVDFFGTNPIEDFRARIIPTKNVVVNKKKSYIPKFIYPNYNHPKWKAKRLVIFKRDNYKCRGCGGENNLHCHHSFYKNGRHIWQYPLNSLITLCENCHNEFHDRIKGKELVVK